jgi:hypothetical protein
MFEILKGRKIMIKWKIDNKDKLIKTIIKTDKENGYYTHVSFWQYKVYRSLLIWTLTTYKNTNAVVSIPIDKLVSRNDTPEKISKKLKSIEESLIKTMIYNKDKGYPEKTQKL